MYTFETWYILNKDKGMTIKDIAEESEVSPGIVNKAIWTLASIEEALHGWV